MKNIYYKTNYDSDFFIEGHMIDQFILKYVGKFVKHKNRTIQRHLFVYSILFDIRLFLCIQNKKKKIAKRKIKSMSKQRACSRKMFLHMV